jgi:hypothetical protein
VHALTSDCFHSDLDHDSFTSLQSNKLSGRLPPSLLDHLPDFMWLDASDNRLTGTVPASFAHSKSLKDLR